MKRIFRYYCWTFRRKLIQYKIEKCPNNMHGKAYEYFTNHKYAKRQALSTTACSEFISSRIEEGKPAMIARIGSTEQFCFNAYECQFLQQQKKSLHQMVEWSGFFPEDIRMGDKFYNVQREAMKEVDLLGIWNLPGEEYCISKYFNATCEIVPIGSLQPWRVEDGVPWSAALQGKRVLVVHPFKESIEKQYKKRDKIFGDTNILPKFHLITYKAVQSLGGCCDEGYNSWEEALIKMEEDIEKIDFDVAIIGCGAYGFPLAAYVKKLGKVAIHMGGTTQLLFGIRGKRWDDDYPFIGKFINEYWTRPLESEKPKNINSVENGCYW